MAQWVNPKARPWLEADRRLVAAKVSPQQVQVAWIKLANIAPTGELAEHGRKLQKDAAAVIRNAKARFPNLRVVYLGSRIYAGYSTGAAQPGTVCVRVGVRRPLADPGPDEGRRTFAHTVVGAVSLGRRHDAAQEPMDLVWKREDLATDGVHPTMVGPREGCEAAVGFLHGGFVGEGVVCGGEMRRHYRYST